MYSVYQVQVGETLESIAQKIGISSTDLIRLNGINNDIMPGQLIVIPMQESIFTNYKVVKGDNIYEIAKKYQINYEDLLRLNGLNKNDYIYPEQELLVPNQGISIYITGENDSILSVADSLGVMPVDLLEENEIYLIPDQIIIYRK